MGLIRLLVSAPQLFLLLTVPHEKKPVRFLLVSGKPLKEPVAWYGPIVMNTQQELQTACCGFTSG